MAEYMTVDVSTVTVILDINREMALIDSINHGYGTDACFHCTLNHIIVTGSRLLLYRKNMWLRMIYCLQIIWWENRKFQWRLWSATIPHREDMAQAGCD